MVQSYTATTTVGLTVATGSQAFLYQFTNLLNNVQGTAYVPRNSVLTLTLKGDANSYTQRVTRWISYDAYVRDRHDDRGYVQCSNCVLSRG